MAGDWIKMRMDLPDDPAVYKLASLLKLDRLSVVGRLYAFWSWADKHAVDGRVDGASSLVVDDITRHDGFADALVIVKWLVIGDDFISIPHHERHNGESAKERGLKNARQARWRDGKDKVASTNVDATPSTKASTREEKRREEKVKRAMRLPTDWIPSPEDIEYAGKHGLLNGTLSAEVEKFRDWWSAAPGQKGCKADWPATWRTWIRKAAEAIPGKPNSTDLYRERGL